MISVINYGFGNIGSIANALDRINIENKIVERPSDIHNYSHIILPGVGSFKKSMEVLNKMGWVDEIKTYVENGNFLVGICLGMQILFDEGEEDGLSKGLGFIEGKVNKIKTQKDEILPHVGWNNLVNTNYQDLIFSNVKKNVDYYFDHSYECIPNNRDVIIAETQYSSKKNFASIVKNENIYGIQFHPEKSPPHGLNLLGNFSKLKK